MTATTGYNAIYAFGDSLSDAGNAYLLTSSTLAASLGLSLQPVSPPYYQETYRQLGNGGTADVFSNGPVWVQDLSQALNLGTLAPSGVGAFANTVSAALASSVGSSEAGIDVFLLELDTGVSTSGNPYIPLIPGATGGTDFAIGGAVTGPTSENSALTALDDLASQLTTFQQDVTKVASNALATVSIGGNDLLAILESSNFAALYGTGTTLANIGATAAGTAIAQSVSLENVFLGGLIATGVSSVVVMNVPDIGQTPEATGLGATDAADATVMSEYYDNLLSADVAALSSGGTDVAIDNAFALIDTAIANSPADGFANVTTPAYTGSSGSYDAADLVSTDPTVQDRYLFFDKLHPTENGQQGLMLGAEQALGLSCFASGTRIRTTVGDVPVEALRLGQHVRLADGETAPIVWIGHREVDCDGEPDPRAVWPVRVRAGAFGPGAPARDLFLSPDHAVFVDGVLIPAKHLIDGDSIVRAPRSSVTYWHLALPRHAVLLAEGLPCESFLDTGGRDDLGFRRPRRADYVGFAWETQACTELVVTGPKLAAARARTRAA